MRSRTAAHPQDFGPWALDFGSCCPHLLPTSARSVSIRVHPWLLPKQKITKRTQFRTQHHGYPSTTYTDSVSNLRQKRTQTCLQLGCLLFQINYFGHCTLDFGRKIAGVAQPQLIVNQRQLHPVAPSRGVGGASPLPRSEFRAPRYLNYPLPCKCQPIPTLAGGADTVL
jgi:hypothetical protein